MRINNKLTVLLAVWGLLLAACTNDKITDRVPDKPAHPIIILYENDVHCAIDGYPMLVSLRKECSSQTNYVSTVSCDDFASGGLVGAISKGEHPQIFLREEKDGSSM